MVKNRLIQEGSMVKHFKHEWLTEEEKNDCKYLYLVKGFAIDSESKEKLIIYQGLYYPYETYARPYEMFMSLVDKEKYPDAKQEYRFEKLDLDERHIVFNNISMIERAIKSINKVLRNE